MRAVISDLVWYHFGVSQLVPDIGSRLFASLGRHRREIPIHSPRRKDACIEDGRRVAEHRVESRAAVGQTGAILPANADGERRDVTRRMPPRFRQHEDLPTLVATIKPMVRQ